MTPATLRGRLARTFAVVGVVALIGVVLAVVAAVRVRDAEERVAQDLFSGYTAYVDLSTALLDQESGFRDFVATEDRSVLARYSAGLRNETGALGRLRGTRLLY